MDFIQRMKIQRENEQRILNIYPTMPQSSGIYMFFRDNDDGKRCVYIGQAVRLLERCGSHLSGKKSHIDKSLMKHKLFSDVNPNGWRVCILTQCPTYMLDEQERKWIDYYRNREDVEIYNVCGGGQIDKAKDIGERQQTKLKSYKNGKGLGYEKARNEVKVFFEKYLDFTIKGNTNKIKERKFNEFKEWLNEGN